MTRGSEDAVYVISVAAELAGVHPQTLRIYERKGLLDPMRTGGGSRRYSDADIELLLRIQSLTNDGLNLAGVRRVLELEQEVARLACPDRRGQAGRGRRGCRDASPVPEGPGTAPPERHRLPGSPVPSPLKAVDLTSG